MSRKTDCQGKKRFATYTKADRIARRQSKRHDGERFTPYQCRYCEGFHVGSVLKTSKPTVPVASEAEMRELDFIEMRNRNR